MLLSLVSLSTYVFLSECKVIYNCLLQQRITGSHELTIPFYRDLVLMKLNIFRKEKIKKLQSVENIRPST